MPQAVLSASRLFGLLTRTLSAEELEEELFRSKAELADWSGDELKVEATADRLDLLCESGLASHLGGALGTARGRVAVSPSRLPSLRIEVDASVAPLRPAIAGIVLESPTETGLDAGTLEEAVRFQELLHATVGRGRKLASLGIYPMARFVPPVRYSMEPISGVRFQPLDGDAPVSASAFFSTHPMAAAYGSFGRDGEKCLTLRDANGEVLSLPPVLNARPAGEAKPGDRHLLLEATGTLASRVQDALGYLLLVFAARGWRAAPVTVSGPNGSDDGRSILTPRSVPLTEGVLHAVLGEGLPANAVEHDLATARLSARAAPGGWMVEVPPWRPDILAEVDLAEEVVLSRGFEVESAILPSALTRGHRRPENRFRAKVAALLLGLGFSPLTTQVMVPATVVRRLGRVDAVEVANPVSELYSHLRDRLLVSLTLALERNVRHGYPQRLSEVGPVIVPDAEAESGARTRYHAATVLAADRAGFADAASLIDYLLGALGTVGVREPVEIPGTLPGRAARVRLAGETVAEVGELHPSVLTESGVPVPVAWAEADLSALWPLLRAPQTP